MIKCPNPECHAINPEGNEHCTSCQTFLPHRYLWAVGQQELTSEQLGKRYVWQHQRIVLDTEPGNPPPSPEPMPHHIWPYLILAPHGLHVPQPYALLAKGPGHDELLLLDSAAIAVTPGERIPKLLPSLETEWPHVSPLRQLNWLWQIATLWPDFTEQQVASSLLLSTHIRVHGSLVRLLELSKDSQPVTLRELGAFWQTLIPHAQPSIHDFFERLCTQLLKGEITNPEVLSSCLDEAIGTAVSGYQVDCGLSVQTDRGPSRKRNEDACYPDSGNTQTHAVGPKANRRHRTPLLLLVCDGIGGHEGGDVASRLAIATIKQELTSLLEWLTDDPLHDPGTITLAIEQAICAANDNISQHNDQGQRQARDRMGTTLVMALIVGVHIYIAHVGDSRAYRISTNSCSQITFDDDVAAREVRLGYSFYADVVNRPGTGALIQALGMGSSSALHVVVQRLILDEDIVLLLCSDGLSDYDRVEQSWKSELLPILTRKLKTTKAVTSLVQLANTYNGHDNITVGVVAGHIQSLKPTKIPLPLPDHASVTVAPKPFEKPSATSHQPTVVIRDAPSVQKSNSPWSLLLGLSGLLGAVTALTMVFFREEPVASPPSTAPILPESIQDQLGQNAGSVGIDDNERATPSLSPRSYLQLDRPVSLLAVPQIDGNDDNKLKQLPDGAIVQVITRQDLAADQSRWVKLKVCAVTTIDQPNEQTTTEASEQIINELNQSTPDSTVTSPEATSLISGSEGWVLEAQLAPIVRAAEVLNCPSE